MPPTCDRRCRSARAAVRTRAGCRRSCSRARRPSSSRRGAASRSTVARFAPNANVAVTAATTSVRLVSTLRTGVAVAPRPGCNARRVPTVADGPSPESRRPRRRRAIGATASRPRRFPGARAWTRRASTAGSAASIVPTKIDRDRDRGEREVQRETGMRLGAPRGADRREAARTAYPMIAARIAAANATTTRVVISTEESLPPGRAHRAELRVIVRARRERTPQRLARRAGCRRARPAPARIQRPLTSGSLAWFTLTRPSPVGAIGHRRCRGRRG